MRRKGNQEKPVGRCVVNLKLVGENDIPIDHYDRKHNMRQDVFDLSKALPSSHKLKKKFH